MEDTCCKEGKESVTEFHVLGRKWLDDDGHSNNTHNNSDDDDVDSNASVKK